MTDLPPEVRWQSSGAKNSAVTVSDANDGQCQAVKAELYTYRAFPNMTQKFKQNWPQGFSLSSARETVNCWDFWAGDCFEYDDGGWNRTLLAVFAKASITINIVHTEQTAQSEEDMRSSKFLSNNTEIRNSHNIL